jgi:hypothetical protein
MTAAAYATNLTTFWLETSTTVTAIGTGGAALGNPETDFFIQGTDCISKGAWTNAVKGFIVDSGGNFTVPTDGAIIFFAKYDAQGSLDTQAGGGFRFIHGNTNSAYDHCYIGGSDTIEFDSWIPYVIDPNTATADTTTGGGASGTHRWAGILADLPTTSGPTKGSPIAIDAIRYGRCDIEYTLGDVTPNGPATFDGAEAAGNVNSTRWGLLELQKGAFQTQGFHSIGTSGTAVDFRDQDKVLFWRRQLNNITDDAVSSAFNRVEIINASTICQWTNIIWSSLSTVSPGTFVHTAGTCDLDICQFFDWDTFTFLAAANVTDCVFSRCLTVTAPGTVMTGSQIIAPLAATDGAGFVYDVATEPDGKLDNMIFEKGSNAHHAIDFGTNFDSSLSSVTLRGIAFNGFGATDDSNDSTVRFLATTGALTLNLIDCTVDGVSPVASGGGQNFSVDDAAGMTVTVVVAPVTLQITVSDAADLQPIQNVQTSIHLKDSPFTELMNEDTTAGGIASESYAGSTPVDIVWRTRKSDDLDTPRYFAQSGLGQITTAGFTLSVLLEENTILP